MHRPMSKMCLFRIIIQNLVCIYATDYKSIEIAVVTTLLFQ